MGGWSHFGLTGCVVTPSLNQTLTPAYSSFHSSILLSVKQAQVERHLTFRDYMRVHGEAAQKYSDLKRELVKQHPNDIERYVDGKDEFIKEIDRKAAEWRSSQARRYMTET
jgi:soluble cytochrome b562